MKRDKIRAALYRKVGATVLMMNVELSVILNYVQYVMVGEIL